MFCVGGGVVTGLLTFVPLFLVEARSTSPGASNVMASILLAAGAAGTLLGGIAAQHFGRRLVLIVPRSNPAGLGSVQDLRDKSVKLVIAGPTVPVGAYTRAALRRLGLSFVLAKVVSQETDVRAVTTKVALGQADAGFVYATDAHAVGKRVRVIPVPARAQPRIRYEIAVVTGSTHRAAAQAWIKALLSARGQAALKEYGFLPLPAG
jgi:molybdenum ABC transporter molybdate-binding protein